ncbi:hypothetical protein C5E45_20425 [Nocardia nova]|uniref:Uncharacterized protein n=1 Tax=Nocardia nova TaxID=37330 RepID=A0A2S6AMI9_9NOCA|nr:hypothetical protein [Nocardia nova]PPJ36416.1 hypothetical protein C5E45_20425 [Nocardia nova]
MTDTGIAQSWPDSVAVITAASDALRGQLSDPDAHPALAAVCGMALFYRQRLTDSQRFSAPPAVINWDQAHGPADTNAAELRQIADFEQIVGTVFGFELGLARPGVLAARLVYWTVCDDVGFAVEAARAYDDCISRLSVAAAPNPLTEPAPRI